MIRHATTDDLTAILAVYQIARDYMKQNNNPAQWGEHYPSEELLRTDIAKQQLYVYETGGQIHGVFAFIIGDDPTYRIIEDGAWLNEEPYGAIHRVAGDGIVKGIVHNCCEFCKSQINNLKIDTHQVNVTMQQAILKEEFVLCGRIYAEDGTPRIAYQYSG